MVQRAQPRAKDVELFLLPEDETEVVGAILREFPEVVFLDERKWEDPDVPPARPTIVECGL